MKILLLLPDAHMHKIRLGPWIRSMREAPISHATVAALTPPHPDIEIRLADESVEPIPFDEHFDLVGISLLTGTARRGYEIASRFRGRGIAVVLGGVHVTILPGEAAAHADAIVVGDAEEVWPRLIEDFRAGRLARVYKAEKRDDDWIPGVPAPRWDLLSRHHYNMANVVHATRGCSRSCDFCSVPVVHERHSKRPVGDVIKEVASLPGRWFAFNDVNLVDDPEYARELFHALIPLRKRWGGLSTVDIAADPEMVELMARSGCRYLLIGFESNSHSTLGSIRKGFNRKISYHDLMALLHAHDIVVQGCFVFGFDHDTKDVFADTVERVNELRIDIPRYAIYTPYPGTPLFQRLEKEGRILSYNWSDYDTMHVVIRPIKMTAEELHAGFKWSYRETFRTSRILARMRGPLSGRIITLLGNTAYRVFARRVFRDSRFRHPYSVDDPGQPPSPSDWLVPDAAEMVDSLCGVARS